MAADARQTNPLAAAAPARLEALFLDAPEVECSKGKASAPYEFGVKASITTTNARAPAGVCVLHDTAMPAIRTMARRVVSALDGAAGASSSSKPLASFRSHVAQPFGKPPVDRSEQIASLLPLALIAPEPRHAHHRTVDRSDGAVRRDRSCSEQSTRRTRACHSSQSPISCTAAQPLTHLRANISV